jgi:hypothetical protein
MIISSHDIFERTAFHNNNFPNANRVIVPPPSQGAREYLSVKKTDNMWYSPLRKIELTYDTPGSLILEGKNKQTHEPFKIHLNGPVSRIDIAILLSVLRPSSLSKFSLMNYHLKRPESDVHVNEFHPLTLDTIKFINGNTNNKKSTVTVKSWVESLKKYVE